MVPAHLFTRSLSNGLGRFLVLMAIGLRCGVEVQGETFFITDSNDTTAATSLRGAIIEANQLGGDNTILLGDKELPGNDRPFRQVFRLTIQGANEDASRTGDLDVTRGHLTIIGLGANKTVIDAAGLGDRVFHVFANAHLTLGHLTLMGGTAPVGAEINEYLAYFSDGESGGAIYNAGTLGLNNCLIKGNTAGDGIEGSSGGNGGGIANDGDCSLTDCVIFENRSGSGGGASGFSGSAGIGGNAGNGGGILNSGTMILTNCIISTNVAGNGGGGGPVLFDIVIAGMPGGPGGAGGAGAGIYNSGQMGLTFSTLDDNCSGNGGDGCWYDATSANFEKGGDGAGIFNVGGLNANTCTITGNICGTGGNSEGSGLAPAAPGGEGGEGGGLCNWGLLNLTSCTIVLNAAGAGGNGGIGGVLFYIPGTPLLLPDGGQGGSGGGIINSGSRENAVVRNSLITLNVGNAGGMAGTNFTFSGQDETNGVAGSDGTGPDLAGEFTSEGFNLVGIADGSSGIINGICADKAGSTAAPIDPLVGPLEMNGGPTPTHTLLPGSPAINQGYSFGVRRDQRGFRRPYEFPGIAHAPAGDGSDIGAFELQPEAMPLRK